MKVGAIAARDTTLYATLEIGSAHVRHHQIQGITAGSSENIISFMQRGSF